MKQLLITSGIIATLILTLPASANADRYDRDRNHSYDRHHSSKHSYKKHSHRKHSYKKHSYRKHSYKKYNSRRHNDSRYYVALGWPEYGSYYGSHHRQQGWPIGVNLNLHQQDRSPDVIVVESVPTVTRQVASAGVFVYPRNGQSMEQRDRDRYECHRWAGDQTGYDPSVPGATNAMAPDYHRAMAACLEGRGYTVK